MTLLNTLFSKIYFINLDKRTDRLKLITEQLNKLNIIAERYPAIKENPFGWTQGLNSGEVSCAWSHRNVLKMALEQDLDSVLILEDDALFCTDFEFKLYEAWRSLPNDWQIIYLGGNNNCILNDKISHRLNKDVYIAKATLTTSAYGVKKELFQKLVDRIEILDKSLDLMYTNIQLEAKAYCFVPALITQCAGFSDVQGCQIDYTEMIK